MRMKLSSLDDGGVHWAQRPPHASVSDSRPLRHLHLHVLKHIDKRAHRTQPQTDSRHTGTDTATPTELTHRGSAGMSSRGRLPRAKEALRSCSSVLMVHVEYTRRPPGFSSPACSASVHNARGEQRGRTGGREGRRRGGGRELRGDGTQNVTGEDRSGVNWKIAGGGRVAEMGQRWVEEGRRHGKERRKGPEEGE